jgi:hypothetical protein
MSINVFQSQPKGSVIFTSSQNWTVPMGVYKIKATLIGGGGGGGGGYSSTYVGGGGGSGGTTYFEAAVTPGTVLRIIVGAGGSGGTGGSSPTAGGNGGFSLVIRIINGSLNGQVGNAGGGIGGGPASSSANGSAGSGAGTGVLMQGSQGSTPVIVTAAYVAAGNAGSGRNPGVPPVLNGAFTGTSGTTYGYNDNTINLSYGAGGFGGGVNANGDPGIQGIVVISWGD